MMTLGISGFAWTFSARDLTPAIFDFVQAAGFRSLEVPLVHPADLPVSRLRRAFEQRALGCTVCCILPKDVNPLSTDAAVRRQAQTHLSQCVQVCAELGAVLIAGPVLAPIGYLPGHRPTPDEFEYAADLLRSVSGLLDSAGLTLAIESVNRSETHFVRTAAEAKRLADAVAHPRVGVTLDTFHANIEEKSLPAAIDLLGPLLRHVHVSENDRGTIGTGHIDFAAVIDALERNSYAGSLTVEGFGYLESQPNAPGFLDADTSVSPDLLASESKAYLDSILQS